MSHRSHVASLTSMAESEDKPSVLRIGQRCTLCNERIASGQSRAAILMFESDDEVVSYQLDAHLDCLQRVAHPAMAERVDPALFKRFKRGRNQLDD
jgi:hypothetical protein